MELWIFIATLTRATTPSPWSSKSTSTSAHTPLQSTRRSKPKSASSSSSVKTATSQRCSISPWMAIVEGQLRRPVEILTLQFLQRNIINLRLRLRLSITLLHHSRWKIHSLRQFSFTTAQLTSTRTTLTQVWTTASLFNSSFWWLVQIHTTCKICSLIQDTRRSSGNRPNSKLRWHLCNCTNLATAGRVVAWSFTASVSQTIDFVAPSVLAVIATMPRPLTTFAFKLSNRFWCAIQMLSVKVK